MLWCVGTQEEMQRRETVILSFLLSAFICLHDENSSVFICVCAKEWVFKKYLFGVVGGSAYVEEPEDSLQEPVLFFPSRTWGLNSGHPVPG